MSWYFNIIDSSSGNVAAVDANKNLKVALPSVLAQAGYVRILDSDARGVLATEDECLKVSMDNLLFSEQVDGTTVNTNKWAPLTSTMTIVQSGGYITLNNAATTGINTNAVLSSIKQLPSYGQEPIVWIFNVKVVALPAANSVAELGCFAATGGATPTDGAFFRWKADNTFRAVINNNGSEVESVSLTGSFLDPDGGSVTLPPVANTAYSYSITVVEDVVEFRVDDVLIITIPVPAAQAYPFNSGRQSVSARVYIGASSPGVAPQLFLGQATVVQQSINQNKLWKETLVSLGLGCYQNATTYGQTANHTNSTSPTSATLSNTAAGYTTLGGRWQFAAPAGAATDFALFGFQVPIGFQFYCSSVAISSMNTGAAVATTATILDWFLGVNASAVSLATPDGSNSWAPRRIDLGLQSWVAADAIGAAARPGDIVRTFDPPLPTDSQRFWHCGVQVPVGTATASQVARGDVTVGGYFE